MTQAQFAELAGVHMQTAARWENKELPRHGVSRRFVADFIKKAESQPQPAE